MKYSSRIVVVLAFLMLAVSCRLEEMGDGIGAAGDAVTVSFAPEFNDFEQATKAVGDGSQVNTLLVQVYEVGSDGEEFISEGTFDVDNGSVKYTSGESIDLTFAYGTEYKVYFWAYKAAKNGESSAYTINDGRLSNGVTVTYPESGALAYDALEHLDAFYAVETVNLSSASTSTVEVSLTRPFAQVNLCADKAELLAAKASKVEFTIDVATGFVPEGTSASGTASKTFTFTSSDYFQSTETLSSTDGKSTIILGTTYLFVPSGTGSLSASLTLYDENGKVLKGPSAVTIPLVRNKRTNLVFSGVEPVITWNEDDVTLPDIESDGWIHIETPEQMAALLLNTNGAANGKKYHICKDIDMSTMPEETAAAIADASPFSNITVDGSTVAPGTGGGRYMVSNLAVPAVFGTASDITVSHLALDAVNVTSTNATAVTHVGTLVNTLKGNGTFTDVTISGSTVSTSNGAAGGIVGYIVRNSEKDRSESLTVSFSSCTVSGTSATCSADHSAGKFVGKLSGYDYQETLTFSTDCSASDITLKKGSATYTPRYIAENKSEWLSTIDYTNFSGFLGDETYNRGTVNYGNNRFVPIWDGSKTVSPLPANSQYDGWASGTVIYSAFDLAYLQGKSLTSGKYYLLSDVDMGGDGKDGKLGKLDKNRNKNSDADDDAVFTPINNIVYLNGVKKEKIGSEQSSLTESDNNTIYNCKVILEKHDGVGAGFIKSTSGSTQHYNVNLKQAFVYNHHDESLPEQQYYEDDIGQGNAYAGTFISNSGSAYKISNVHVSSGHVFALCKIGGLIGRVTGTLDMSNCSVHDHTVENWEANVINWYPMIMPISSSQTVYVNGYWYTQGECGGLIGFIQSTSALIDKCSVVNTNINCYGQPDKTVTAGIFENPATGFSIKDTGPDPGKATLKGYTVIAGRHVNQFIGDVVSQRSEDDANNGGTSYTVTIRDYYVSGNKYWGKNVDVTNPVIESKVKSSSPTIDTNRHCYNSTTTRHGGWFPPYTYTHTNTYCNCVGSAYYVGVDVNAVVIKKHVQYCAGTLIFNAKGDNSVILTEDIWNGNDRTWTGGNFSLIN